MNCNGCIANTIAQTALGNRDAFTVALKAMAMCQQLRDARVCDQQPSAALVLDMRRPVEVTR
jgi:hypothetical protein